MYTNKFDKILNEISFNKHCEWDEASKIFLFAKFLEERHPETYQEWQQFLESESEAEEEPPTGPCFPVEWDRNYYGGDYGYSGEIAYIPFALLKDNSEAEVHKAFERITGVSPVHIVHYTLDEQYKLNGDAWEACPYCNSYECTEENPICDEGQGSF